MSSVFARTSRTALGTLLSVLAALLVWFALVAPDDPRHLSPGSLIGIPLEGLILVALVLVLPPRVARPLLVLAGVLLGLLTVLRLLDLGFFLALDRRFDPVGDLGYLGPAVGLLTDSIGRVGALVVAVLAGVLLVGVVALMPLATLRLGRVVDRHRVASLRAVGALAAAWAVCALAGVQLLPGVPLASTSATSAAIAEVRQVRAGIADQRRFDRAATRDSFDADAPSLLAGLRGKDVLLVFIESYGKVAVQGSSFSPKVDAVLDRGTGRLRSSGFDARSAFLTSPTFGGISWLAHSTLQSGLWVDSELRYQHIVSTPRFTLSRAFKRAGWRTVADVPSNTRYWQVGKSFYGYDHLYDGRNVGYHGPKFSYAAMPDQYTLDAFRRRELSGRHRAPVMAEIDLVSSHTPWTPLPHLVPWGSLGDGSVFDGMPAQGPPPGDVWPDPARVQDSYGKSIRYTWRSLISFVQHYGRKNLVMVVLGDHQPTTIVSGEGASHDVPVSIVAHDPRVIDRISGWGWQPGLRPAPDATVWPMSAFRDRFLTAFGGR
ncbi:MAG: hypothetical protein QOK15_594 [Nocardioidaceae bacterium]|nr:hypothetical protein [Nocardioidaceae bacterium]